YRAPPRRRDRPRPPRAQRLGPVRPPRRGHVLGPGPPARPPATAPVRAGESSLKPLDGAGLGRAPRANVVVRGCPCTFRGSGATTMEFIKIEVARRQGVGTRSAKLARRGGN